METLTEVLKKNDLRFTINLNDDKTNCKIEINLNDECKNGHQDFSITATFWQVGEVRSDRNMIAGGCCHDDILNIRPDLQIFVNLHLCDWQGVPMYAVENGFYHLKEGFNNTKPSEESFKTKFCEYYRLTLKQFEILSKSENKTHYAILLMDLGILDQWKEEADKAIKILENLCNCVFICDSVKSQFNAPAEAEIYQFRKNCEEGYYLPQNQEKRRIMKIRAARSAEKFKIKQEMDKAILKAKIEHYVKSAVLKGGLSLDNFIYYSHSCEGVFNWKNYGKQVTEAEFNKFMEVTKIEGITFKLGK
jgi:hypothetical protein